MTFHAKLQRLQNHCVIRFDKINGFIKIYHEIRYLVLFDAWRDII